VPPADDGFGTLRPRGNGFEKRAENERNDRGRGTAIVTSRLLRSTARMRARLRKHEALDRVATAAATSLWRRNLRRKVSAGPIDPERIVWLRPRDITLAFDVNQGPFVEPYREQVGSVLGGDWDKSFPLEENVFFPSARAHFGQGTPWEQTEFYARLQASIARGGTPYRCRTADDVPRRLGELDQLYQDISRNGYAPQRELPHGRPWDEILVVFDRHGQTLFFDGRHRLAVARALDIDRVPALVLARHERWCDFVREARAYVGDHGGRSYQPVLHPDLADIPSHHGSERFDLIAAQLPLTTGRLLDIGANWGYFSHRFEERGFECWAVESSRMETHFLVHLRRAAAKKFHVVSGSILDVELPERFDVVLALNIFHHFLKQRDTFEALQVFLRRLNTRFLVLETHLPGGQMRGAYFDPSPQEFVQWVGEQTGLTGVEALGEAADGRPLFLLGGGRP